MEKDFKIARRRFACPMQKLVVSLLRVVRGRGQRFHGLDGVNPVVSLEAWLEGGGLNILLNRLIFLPAFFPV